MNKFLLIIIAVVLYLALAKLLYPSLLISYRFSSEGMLFVAQVIGLIMMLVNGTFMNTRYFRISILALIIIFIGAAMKIMHLPGADQTISISFLIIPLLYLIHFVLKNEKGHLDILKLLTVFAFSILPVLVMLYIIPRDYTNSVRTFNHVIFWLTFVDFLLMGLTKRTLLQD